MSDPRTALLRLAEEGGHTLKTLSAVIGRNPSYLQQYVRRETPRRLAEEDRGRLARFLGVTESALGGRAEPPGNGAVPWLSPRPSAGPGGSADGDRRLGELGLPPTFLRGLGATPGRVSAVTVAGDSMEPTLRDGDLILVDHAAADRPPTDGVHVLRQDGALLVKRLLREVGGRWTVASDNVHVPDQIGVALTTLAIVGRVLWVGHPLR